MKHQLLFLFLLAFSFELQGQEFAKKSILAKGDFYKIKINESGIYKLDFGFFQEIGISPENLNPSKVQVFGNPGGMLPQANDVQRYDDLLENSVWVYNPDNSKQFDKDDYILFYAQGPDKVYFDTEREMFLEEVNLYTNANYYFIRVDREKSEKVDNKEALPLSDLTTAIHTFDYYHYHEKEAFNLLSSGREWFGEKLSLEEAPVLNFKLDKYLPSSEAAIKLLVQPMNRETTDISFDISLNRQVLGEVTIEKVPRAAFGEKGKVAAWYKFFSAMEFLTDSLIEVGIALKSQGEDTEAYLDYFAIQYESALAWKGEAFQFRSLNSKANEINTYRVSQLPKEALVWNISQPEKPVNMSLQYETENTFFVEDVSALQEYITFLPEQASKPEIVGKINNQNLHHLSPKTLLIITPDSLTSEVTLLANFRENVDGLSVLVVRLEEIYNEFSSGRGDVSSIRDFIRMLYTRNSNKQKLKYVLLFGDTSYDYKGIESKAENLIPIYESRDALHTVHSYASDDYFGFMEPQEGEWAEVNSVRGDVHDLDIGIGRLPIRNKEEAKIVVNKLMHYQTPESMGRWRLQTGFVADNGDENKHQLRSDFLATELEEGYPLYTPDRLFVDAFPVEKVGSSKTSPEAKRMLDEFIEEGKLIIDYIGHGAESGWTNEKVLTNGQAMNWRNLNNMPVFVTATCEYGRFDDWKRRSGAELALMNPLGGPIGLLTTTRPVVASTNFKLSQAFYEAAFEPIDGEMPRLGDIVRLTKNKSVSGTLNRNFSLLGDPSMRLAYPTLNVFTEYLNGKPLADEAKVKSGEKITITGYIGEKAGKVEKNFAGTLETIVYAAAVKKQTLGNEGENTQMTYYNRETILYKGIASIKAGNFEIDFVVPTNIDLQDEALKLSFYASHITDYKDAAGYKLLAVSSEPIDSVFDNTPPEVSIYLDHPDFKPGDETGIEPVFYAQLSDASGISTVGEAKAIKLIVDDEASTMYTLNNYYENDLDSYQSGQIKFEIPKLSPGLHFLSFEVWDNSGNKAETGLFFTVTDGLLSVIENLIVHPNPSFDSVNFSFPVESDETGFSVAISLLDVKGNIVQEISGDFTRGQSEEKILQWNGKSPGGYRLGSGTYFYEITVNFHTSAKVETTSGQFILLN
ncbi:MAG: type IX secretion system sortase PorU [Bacteroidota bacterium]